MLLAVDLGLRAGLAVYRQDGRLQRYESRHYRNRQVLKQAAWQTLRDEVALAYLVLEGGGPLSTIWERAAERQAIPVLSVQAEEWRQVLLLQRQQRSGSEAKRVALAKAREVIEWSGAARPTSLRDDAAEAILAGLWGVLQLGWLPALPHPLEP